MSKSRCVAIALLFVAVALLSASIAMAGNRMTYLVRQRVQDLYPGGQIVTVDMKDGLYFIFLTYGGERVLLELTRGGQVIDEVNLGPTATTGELIVYLPPNVAGAAQRLNPEAKVISATEDANGVFRIGLRDQFGVVRTVSVTRSGRVLGYDPIVQNQQSLRRVGIPQAQHNKSVRRLPSAVLAGVERVYPGGVIVAVGDPLQSTRYARPTYVVTVVSGYQVFNVGLTETGRVLENRLDNMTVRLEQLPISVRAAALSLFPEGVLYGAESPFGSDRYQVDVLSGGMAYYLEIGPRGEVISTRRDYGG